MALTDKLSAIGNAIRAKTGKTDSMTLDQMPVEIEGIQTGGDTHELLRQRLTNTLEYLELDLQGGRFVERAFNTCTSLKTAKIYNIGSVRGQFLFYLCSGLETAELAFASKNSAATLPSYSFRDCGVNTVVLKNCYRIEGSCFQNAINLVALVLLDTETITATSNTNIFIGTPIASGTGYIYVPRSLIENYKVATNWVTYANQFRAIEDYPEICGGAE